MLNLVLTSTNFVEHVVIWSTCYTFFWTRPSTVITSSCTIWKYKHWNDCGYLLQVLNTLWCHERQLFPLYCFLISIYSNNTFNFMLLIFNGYLKDKIISTKIICKEHKLFKIVNFKHFLHLAMKFFFRIADLCRYQPSS